MWNNDLNTLDDFLCISHNYLRYLDPFRTHFPKIAPMPQIPYKEQVEVSDGRYTYVRSHLMWNHEMKTFDDFLCLPSHDLRYLDPTLTQFSKMTLMHKIP